MYETPIVEDDLGTYDGSRIFTRLAEICGLSIDLLNFLVCQILALFFASFFRSYLHTSKVTTNIRHAFGLTLGLYFGYFCFGQQAIHIVGLPAVCYIIIRTQDPQIVQRLVMVVSMVYLSLVHLHRTFFDNSSYSLDITGPLMVITQKVTLLTFSIHDGLTRDESELSKSQLFHAIKTLPTTLEYFSYMLNFQGLMAGPLVFYKDYIEFIEGTNLLKHNTNAKLDQNGKPIIMEPSPTKAVVKKVIGSVICAYIFMNWATVYPIKRISEDDFVDNDTFFYKMWYLMMSTTVIRFKYYHAWLLADAICNNSGLGFNGYEKDGNPKWDLITNINVIGFELATNLRDAINNWNMGTNQWLRMVVYERVPRKYGTSLTFGLSALWHGFYAGYYITFATGALILSAARVARKLFRHRFQHSEHSRGFYDILTVLTTRIFMGYFTFPFILLEFKASLRLYLNLFMYLHLVALATLYILPRFIRVERKAVDTKPTTTTTNGIQSKTITADIDRPSNGIKANGLNGKQHQVQSINTPNENGFHDGKGHTIDNNYCDININDNRNDLLTNGNGSCNGQLLINGTKHLDNNDKLSTTTTTATANDKIELNDYRQDKSSPDNHLSLKIRERIDSETRNIEEFIDKTVTGIVEPKDDLMRVNDEMYVNMGNGHVVNGTDDGLRRRNLTDLTNGKEIEAFICKEMNSVNVAGVLSNGHVD